MRFLRPATVDVAVANPVGSMPRTPTSYAMKHNLREILHVHDSDITDSHFANAKLVKCRFQNVNFSQSKFTDVDFSEVSFADVNLMNAAITNANLLGMRINGILVSDLLAAYQKRNCLSGPPL
jgi:uncharacterized protein YjbI with pentapeptide repeats